MLAKCKEAYNKFMEVYSEYNYCIPDDGGFNFLRRYEDFKYCMEMNGIRFGDDDAGNYVLEFNDAEQAKEFYDMIKWLAGKDYHFTSCQVTVELQENKVLSFGYDW